MVRRTSNTLLRGIHPDSDEDEDLHDQVKEACERLSLPGDVPLRKTTVEEVAEVIAAIKIAND